MGIHSFLRVLEDILLVHFKQIKRDVVWIWFDSVCEEIDAEGDLLFFKVLKWQSESSGQNEDFDDLLFIDKLVMMLQKLQNVVMMELNFWFDLVVVFSFVFYHYRDEIKKLHGCLLVFIDLSVLDRNKLISSIFFYLMHAINLEDMRNNIIIMWDQKIQQILPRQIEVWIPRNSEFQLFVLLRLGDYPTIVDEFSSVL